MMINMWCMWRNWSFRGVSYYKQLTCRQIADVFLVRLCLWCHSFVRHLSNFVRPDYFTLWFCLIVNESEIYQCIISVKLEMKTKNWNQLIHKHARFSFNLRIESPWLPKSWKNLVIFQITIWFIFQKLTK